MGSKFASREQRLRQTGRKGIHLTFFFFSRMPGNLKRVSVEYKISLWLLSKTDLTCFGIIKNKAKEVQWPTSRFLKGDEREHRLVDSCNPQVTGYRPYEWVWLELPRRSLES